MIEIEVVVVIAVALAAWLFVHFRKKMHKPEVESVVAQKVSKVSSEPEPVKVDAAVVSAVTDVIPEDSTLRRHYLQNLANAESVAEVDVSEAEAVVQVDMAVVSEVTDVVPEVDVSESEPVVEIDTAVVSAVTDVIPEDSTLRRHYLQNLANAEAVIEPVVNEEPVLANVAEEVPLQADVAGMVSGAGIPEDVVLKRHFIQQLTAEIEVQMLPRPTDSTLKRHYDAQLLSAVNCQLDALK